MITSQWDELFYCEYVFQRICQRRKQKLLRESNILCIQPKEDPRNIGGFDTFGVGDLTLFDIDLNLLWNKTAPQNLLPDTLKFNQPV